MVVVPGARDVSTFGLRGLLPHVRGRERTPAVAPYLPKLADCGRACSPSSTEGLDGPSFDSAQPWTLFAVPELRVAVAGPQLDDGDEPPRRRTTTASSGRRRRPGSPSGCARSRSRGGCGSAWSGTTRCRGSGADDPATLRDAATLDAPARRPAQPAPARPGPRRDERGAARRPAARAPRGRRAGRDRPPDRGRAAPLDARPPPRPARARRGAAGSATWSGRGPHVRACPARRAAPAPRHRAGERPARPAPGADGRGLRRTRPERPGSAAWTRRRPQLLVTNHNDGLTQFAQARRARRRLTPEASRSSCSTTRPTRRRAGLPGSATRRGGAQARRPPPASGCAASPSSRACSTSRDYVDGQTARLRADPRYPPHLYVPQRYRELRGADHGVRDGPRRRADGLLAADEGRFVLVLGDFGRGKTFALREVAAQARRDRLLD